MAITITGITPATGPTTGSSVHYITGTDLTTVTGVTIDGNAALTFAALSATLLKVTAPTGSTGAVDVVLNPGAVTLTGGFTYQTQTTGTLVSTLARDYALDVNTGTVQSPTWLSVRAIGSLKPVLEPNMEDDSDYDSDGWGSEVKTQLKWSLETTLLRKRDKSTGNYDAGQEVIRAASAAFGGNGVAHVRWYDKEDGPEAYEGHAGVTWSPEGGKTTDTNTVSVKLTGNGTRTLITNPAV